jgi:NodT family efflux transporter outer membrane factor (OMF) lipoprotein
MSYYELLALDQELDIIQETISLQDSALSIAVVQKEAGAANELAVKQFRSQLLNSKAMETDVAQMITELENMINTLLGRFPQTIIRDKASFMSAVPGQVRAGIPSELLRNRPDIKQAELELLASKADVKAARALFYPSLTITGGAGFQAYKTKLLFTSPESFIFSAFGSLTAPLINRSAIQAEFKSANAYQMEALYSYEKSILSGYQEVSNELSNINNLQKKYAFKNEQVNELNESIETSSELFRTGRATYLEIIITQQSALQAKLELVDVKKRQLNATVNLYKALGGGWR